MECECKRLAICYCRALRLTCQGLHTCTFLRFPSSITGISNSRNSCLNPGLTRLSGKTVLEKAICSELLGYSLTPISIGQHTSFLRATSLEKRRPGKDTG